MTIIQQLAQRGHQILRDAVEATALKTRYIGSGECILRQGEEIAALYWITLGEYTMHYSAGNGKTFSLGQRFVSDTLIGEIEYLTHTPSQFSVVAHEPMTVSVIPRAMMDQLLARHAEVGVWLSQLLSLSYQRGMAKTMERFLQPLLFNIASDLYERHLQSKPLVDFTQVSREAERFGCSERAYRRVLQQLVAERFIEKIDSEYALCDAAKFRQMLRHSAKLTA